MCIICKEWKAERLTNREAYRAIGESFISAKTAEEKQHLMDLSDEILNKLEPETTQDASLDTSWHDENYGDE